MFKKCACMSGHVSLHIVLPSLNKHYHLLTFPSFIAPSSHTSKIFLWISSGWTFLGFKIHITDCTSQAVGNSIFIFSFKYYSGCGGIWLCSGQYTFSLMYRRWLNLTGNASVNCIATICHQFLLHKRALYIKFGHDHFLTIVSPL